MILGIQKDHGSKIISAMDIDSNDDNSYDYTSNPNPNRLMENELVFERCGVSSILNREEEKLDFSPYLTYDNLHHQYHQQAITSFLPLQSHCSNSCNNHISKHQDEQRNQHEYKMMNQTKTKQKRNSLTNKKNKNLKLKMLKQKLKKNIQSDQNIATTNVLSIVTNTVLLKFKSWHCEK